jgi:HK97 family phage prohead protease
MTTANQHGLLLRATESAPEEAGKRTLQFVASDETPDRVGDVIKVSGWNLSEYKKNPVVLWGHDTSNVPPIGRAINVRRGKKPNGDPALYANIEFAPEEAHPFAETVYQLAKRGFLNAVSVGFLPRATKELSEEEKSALGMPTYGQMYSKADLMEISVVSVPANPSALVSEARSLVRQNLVGKGQVERFLDHISAADELTERLKSKIRGFIDLGAVQTAKPGTLAVGDMVRWNSSGGTARGKITRIVTDGTINVPNSSFTVEGTEDNPAALIRVHDDDGPTDVLVGHRFSALTKVRSDVEITEKSPACRQDGETQDACVERKIPELVDEGMAQDQAVAVANELCETDCSEKADPAGIELRHIAKVEETEAAYVVTYLKQGVMELPDEARGYKDDEEEEEKAAPADPSALDALHEAQAEQARALTTLADTISDLTKRLDILAGGRGAGAPVAPEAPVPAPAKIDSAEVESTVRRVTDEILTRLKERTQR